MAKAKKSTASPERQVTAALPIPTVEPQAALGAAKTVAKRVSERATRAALDALSATALDPAYARDYPALVAAAETASAAYASTQSVESDARVPLALVDRANKLRAKLHLLVDYHLGHDEDVARELAAIRAGHGYADLASDLLALAQLVESNVSELKDDRRNYASTDVAEARQLAAEIQTARVSGQRPSTRNAARAWASAFHALREAHEELLAAGRFLERKRADVIERWPSLFVSVGTAKKKPAKKPASPASPTGT
jgi:hypothetical protein